MHIALAIVLWVAVLMVFTKTKMGFFKFVVGSVGAFVLLMYFGRYSIEKYLQYYLSYLLGLFGDYTGLFVVQPKFSMITAYSGPNVVSFFIDYECSGFVEIVVYVCLVAFYPIYGLWERIKYSLYGAAYIFGCNFIRVVLICILVKVFGMKIFFFAHTILARIMFFAFMVILYYKVFTKPHILRQKVGGLKYEK